jgi:hypothetical protein
MLAVQGYFEAGRFVSSDTAKIPEHKNVIVVLSDEQIPASCNAEAWRRFLDAVKSIDEEVPAEFERASFRREVEI